VITARRSGPRWRSGRTGASSSPDRPRQTRHKGLSYLLVPMRQPVSSMRPITQLTGTSEFNEVFFDGARTSADMVVGEVGDGWRVALATLAFERGVALLGHQVRFSRELDSVIDIARARDRTARPGHASTTGERLAHASILRMNTLRSLQGTRRSVVHARSVDLEALLGHLASRPRRAGDGRERA
jgi:alkylation response protein AidB-like acyl-CoA dehydrogenase